MIHRRAPEDEPGRASDDTDADILGGREWVDEPDPWLNQTGCLIAIACAGAVTLTIVVGGWLAVTGLGLGP